MNGGIATMDTMTRNEHERIHLPLQELQWDSFCNDHGIAQSRLWQLIWSIVVGSHTGSNQARFRCILPEADSKTQQQHRRCHEEVLCMVEMHPGIKIIDLLQDHQGHQWQRHPEDDNVGPDETLLVLNTGSGHRDDRSPVLPVQAGIAITVETTLAGTPDVFLTFDHTPGLDHKARRMAATTHQVATQILRRPHSHIEDLDLCSEEDVATIRAWSERIANTYEESVVDQVIAQRCVEQPDAMAVSAWDGELTYRELDRRATTLATHLASRGVCGETFVALCFEKSKWTIVALLAVLKAGGAYVLLDPSYPQVRMKAMCDDLQVPLALASPSMAPTARSVMAQVVVVAEDAYAVNNDASSAMSTGGAGHHPGNALYAVFTSGSTGRPKGIVVEHGAFCSRAATTGRSLGLQPESRVLQFASHAFDVVNRDVLFTLMLGACICVPSDADRVNRLETFMTDHRVSWASITPSVADLLDPTRVPHLQTLVLVGEAMSPGTLATWAHRVQIVNGYGPAECVTLCSVRSGMTPDSDPHNIGHGEGSLLWLVDPQDHQRLVPVGAVGEILVSGVAVGRGYVNDPEKTAAVFLQDTAWLPRVCPQFRGRLYKTGDLAQYTGDADGSMRFLGRKDNQVKIHGQRVELGEVEQHVRSALAPEGIEHVVVDLVSLPSLSGSITGNGAGATGEHRLAAFLASSGGKPVECVDEDDLRALLGPAERAPDYLSMLQSRLAASVPRYMVPVVIIPLLYIPLNRSAKTDRKTLRRLPGAMQPYDMALCMGTDHEQVPCDDDLALTRDEEWLRTQWSRVLNVAESSIGQHDNFFHRGGDSLAAIKLAGLARDAGVALTFEAIFLEPTLAAQASIAAATSVSPSSSPSDSTAATNHSLDFYDTTPAFALISGPETRQRDLLTFAAKECGLSPSQIEDMYPTTPMQEGLMALTAAQPGTYISQRVYDVRDGVSLAGLEHAWRATFDANPPLRTRIIQLPEGETLQVVVRDGPDTPTITMPTTPQDLSEYLHLHQGEQLSMSLGAPLARLAVVSRQTPGANNQDKLACVLTMHHSVFDAWSITLVLEQVEAAYRQTQLPLRPLGPFVRYIGQAASASRDHWSVKLARLDAVQFPSLPSPTYTPMATGSTSVQVRLPTPSATTTPVTLSNRIRLAWALTVASYTGLNDVVFGVTVSGRNAAVPGIEQMAGATLATYPLRVQLRPSSCVAEELQAVQHDAVATLPFEQLGLQHISALGEEAARACRFQSLLVVQQPEAIQTDQAERNILSPAPDVDGQPTGGTHALTVLCTPSGTSQSVVEVEGLYDARVLPEAQTRRALHLFAHFLTQLTSADPDQRVADLSRLSDEDQKQLAVWNREVHPRLPVCVHRLIEQHAQCQPQAPAIAAWDGDLTYAELDDLSSQLTSRLIARGVRRETFVPLCMHKSRWVAVAMLAVSKAGGAFILLDPSHPIPRLQHICQDSTASIVVSSTSAVEVAQQLGCHVLPVGDTTGIESPDGSDDDPMLVPSEAKPEDALYAVFTSGSTGKPKGVVVEHGTFATNAIVTGPDYLLNKDSRVLQFASHAFDATVLDYLFPLICGGCVCVPEEAASRDDLGGVINDLGVNWAALTPSVARILDPDSLPQLQVLALVGEAAKAVDVVTWADHVRLLNAYGPAECSVVSTIQTRVLKDSAVGDDTAYSHNPANIGRSVAGATWLVDPDDHDKLTPIGAAGELLLQGPMVGRGYLDNEEQTNASFIAFPSWMRRLRPQDHSGKMYKTGDLARYSPSGDGSLDYIGRKDNQVKLRGQRIELGEVEAQVGQCLPSGCDVVVDIITPREPNAQPMLVAFVWDSPAGSGSQQAAQAQAQDHSSLLSVPHEAFRAIAVQAETALGGTTLPRHMIPTLFILLTHLPLSPTGKANRRCIKEYTSSLTLRELEQYRGNVSSAAGSSQCKRRPASNIETTVVQLVSRVLQLDHADIGIDDNFFHVGGNSLSAMAISTQARRMGLDVSVGDIFNHPQLSVLAGVVTGRDNPNNRESEDQQPEPFSMLSVAGGSRDNVINETMEQCGLTQHQRHLIDDIYPCTPMQEGLFALTMQQPGAYVTKLALDLLKDIDITRFHAALEAVCQANPILRTRIVPVGADGQLHQVVINTSNASVVHGPTSSVQDHEQPAFCIRPGGPLARIQLVALSEDRYRVVFRLHHSIYDGISIKLTLDQLEEAYSSQAALPMRPYSPFVRYCSLAPDATDFWKQELADACTPAFPPVPMDGFVLQSPSSIEKNIPFRWGTSTGVPMSAILKLAWGIIVSQYTGEKDVIFGTVVSGRSASVPDIEQLSGPTIATVPFRVRHDASMTVQDALTEVQGRTTRMLPFEQTGLQRIRQLGYDDACRFQNLLLIQLPGVEDAPESDLYHAAPTGSDNEQPVFDTYPLTMLCTPMADSLAVRAIHDRGVIDSAFVQRVIDQFLHVVTHLNSPVYQQQPLHDMPQVSVSDLAQLREWNGSLPQSEDHCVHELVEGTAATFPLAPAICAWDGEFTYTRLNQLASLLACQLLSLSGLDPDAIIPIYFEKSRWTAVAALAVLKAGRTIMMLDTAYPMQRVEEICQATQPFVIISSVKTASRASSLAPTNIKLSDQHVAWLEKHLPPDMNGQLSSIRPSPNHAMYVVFTSGSTGKPKGVVVPHRAFSSMSRAHARIVGFSPDMRALAFSSYAFDVSISDIFNPLLAGGCVCVPSDTDRTENLPEIMARLRVNYADMTPSLLRTLRPEDVPSVKTVVLGGEALTREIVGTWAPHVRLCNLYGPAECCVSSTVHAGLSPDSDPSDIGVGAGSVCWVVDPADHGRLVPNGAVGELLIEGPIVGHGYLHNPVQTMASFVEPPNWLLDFRPAGYRGRLYKSGDLVQYTKNGSIRFLGRKDNQVKLRGQRIELEEVEHHIRQALDHRSGDGVVVEMIKAVAPRQAFLAAFVLCESDMEAGQSTSDKATSFFSCPSPNFRELVASVESKLQDRMPAYMMPAVFIPLLHLPLTPTGKTDRRRLREAASKLSQAQLDEYRSTASAGTDDHCMPTTAKEQSLQRIWARVLNRPVEQISVKANFLRLGGDSISAMQLSSQSRAAGYPCSVADIFKYKNIAAIASIIDSDQATPGSGTLSEVERVTKEEQEKELRGESFALSPIQQVFFNEVPALFRHHYNQSFLLRLSHTVALEDISSAVRTLINRHGMLRTRFYQADGDWVQAAVQPDGSANSPVDQQSAASYAEAQSIMANTQQSLAIEQGRVFQVNVIDVDGDGQYMFLVAHHLVIDLVSWRVILDDLESLLTTGDKGSSPSLPSLSFRTWCRLQQDYSRAQLAPDSVLSTPLPPSCQVYWDLAPEQNTFGDGIDTRFTLDEGVTSALLGPANEAFGTSIVDLLHAALLHSFVQAFQDRPAPVVFSEGHGREPWEASIDVFRTVGWFTTLWPTYVPATAQMDIADIARHIKDGRRQIPGNGWAYFASRYLHPEGRRQFNTHGLPEITFNYLGQFQQLERKGALLQPSKALSKTADISPGIPRPTIFDVSASVSQGQLQMEFSHSRHLPQATAVRDWISQCEMSLRVAAQSLSSRPRNFTLCDLPLLRLSGYQALDQLVLQSMSQIGVKSADIANICPCSPIQQGILLSQARDPTRYITREIGRVMPTTNSPVDMDQFQKAWQTVVDRHAILRTVFTESPGASSQGYWVQVVLKPGAMSADMQVVQHLEPSTTNTSVDMDMAMGTKRPAHRLVLCRKPDGALWYDLSIHHALVDGMSSRLIQQDLVRAYDDKLSERASDILPYPEYIAYLQQQSETDSRDYWSRYLNGVETCHFPALIDHGPAGLQERHSVDASLSLPVHYSETCGRIGVTLANVLQLAWALTLRCYTGVDSVCFAYLTSGRDIPLRGIEQAVGPFINLLASRMDLPEHASLQTILQGVQADYTAALDHQHCSIADVLHGMDQNGRTLFNTGISIQSASDSSPSSNDTSSIVLDVVDGDDAVDFDLTLNVSLRRDVVTMTLDYSNCILSSSQASEVTNLFCRLVSDVIDHYERPLGQLPCFSSSPEGRIWQHFSGCRRSSEYWRNHSINIHSATGFPSLPAGDYVPVLDSWLQSSPVPMRNVPQLSVLLRAAWAIVQAHHTDSDNVVFAMGMPEQGLMPCCLQISPHDSVDNVLSAVRCHVGEATSLSQAKTQSLLQQLPSHGVAFCVENASEELPDPSTQDMSHSLVITASVRQNDSFQLMAHFDSHVLDQVECQRLLQHTEQAVHSIMQRDLDQKVKDVPVISPADMAQLREWHRDIPTPVNRCVQDIVLDRCDEDPAAMAVSAWDGCLSYGQLRDLSARLAAHLLEQSGGLVQGAKVPICMDKSQCVPVAILGVLRAGATCVMIDPSHPPQRIRELTRDLDAPLAVVSSSGAAAMQDIVPKSVTVSSSMLTSLPVHLSADYPLPPGNPRSPAFIVFTSGSTGTPKGIVMLHANLSTALRDLLPSHNITKGLRMLHFASYAFDASLGEIFYGLSSGSCLCIPSADDRINNLGGFIRDQRIDWAILTPSAAAVLHPADVPSLRTLVLVGEPLPSRAVDLWAADRTLINGYGPAEATFCCAAGFVPPHGWKPGTIGPVVNGLGWITAVSDTSRLAAIGAVGELLVEGPALTAGYLNEPEKTASAFIRGPKWLRELRDGDPAAARMYRTGDLVQYTSDGAIRFVGRRDKQVKLNGQRIELGEVEHNVQAGMAEGSAVVAELVTPAGDHARPLLAAFVCLQPGQGSSINSSDLIAAPSDMLRSQLEAARAHALLALPRHMVPSVFVPLNYIPSSIAGKTDRRRLLQLANSMSRGQMGRFIEGEGNPASSLPPSTAVERKLQQLFSQALEIPPETINANDSFFELGGDSIRAMALVSMARQTDSALSIADIFRSPRLTDLASVMAVASESAAPSKQIGNEGQLSLEQKINLYASSRLGISSRDSLRDSVRHSCSSQLSTSTSQIVEVLPVTAFQNIELREQPCIYRILHLEGDLDHERLEVACQALVQRHTILRTVFRLQGDTALQLVHERPVVRLQLLYQTTENPSYTEQVCALLDNDKAQFNAPITQFTLVKGPGPSQHRLIIRLSHSQYDGLSMPILYHDLGCLYSSLPLSPAPPFTAHMEHWLDAQTNQQALSYWQGMLEASNMTYLCDPSLRQVDGDKYIGEMDTLIMAQGRFHIGSSIQKQTGNTTATLVKAAWATVLAQLTQQQDVTFAQMANTRALDAPDSSNIVGPCINPTPVRTRFESSWTVLDLLQSIQDQQANSGPFNILDYRDIVDRCSPWPRGTLFGSLITHQNMDTGSSSSFCIGDAECVSVDSSTGQKLHLPPLDTVMITTFPSADGSNLEIQVEASNRTMGQGLADDIVQRMQDVVHRFVNGPETRLSELLA